jgi:GNAT superfamily N-acetyltransferase
MKTFSTCTPWVIKSIDQLDISAFINQYGKAIETLVLSAFDGLVTMTNEELGTAIDESTHVGLLIIEGQLAGFMLGFIPAANLEEHAFFYINKVAIARKYQGHGLGSPRMLLNALKVYYPQSKFGWIAARTQAPTLLRSFINLPGVSFPFTNRYNNVDGNIGMDLLMYSFISIPQLRFSYEPGKIIHEYGIIKNAYPHKLTPSSPDEGNFEAEDLLRCLKFNRDAGDVLLIVSQLFSNAKAA